jgi:hypothetical protein
MLEQFALDPLVSPAVILGGEPLDQRGDLGADRRPSYPVRVGPFTGDQAAVPTQDGAGVTSRCVRSRAGRSRISAARTARSAQSSRGRGWVRRSTATSCRSTRSSAFLEADDRPSRTSHPQTRTKMRSSRRKETDDHDAVQLTWLSPQFTGQADFWHPTGAGISGWRHLRRQPSRGQAGHRPGDRAVRRTKRPAARLRAELG